MRKRATLKDVPRDVSIVGFNDMPFVDQFRPPLTTVRIPHRELGRRAADLLLAALENASSGGDPPQGKARLPLELVERTSASSPPRKS